jgi:LuxR family maltose regulon positive regulatory protein
MPEQHFQSNVPLLPGNQIYLERSRIDVLLEKAIQNPLTMIVAGAGYGKTHAVYSFVRKYQAQISWMQFSEQDNIAEHFWENFVAGVALSNPKVASRLAKINFPETERQLERYMAIPLDEIDPAARAILVYDDFHLIQNPAVLRFMERSFSSPFPHITSVIISRSEPPINTMRFLSKGLLGRVTEKDLRFSREEMTEYFDIQNIRLLPQTLSSIYHDTEGWAFAIHLVGLSLKNTSPGTPYIPQAMRKNIFMLIKSEVMDAVSEGLRRFLIKLSLIDHLVQELLEDLAEDRALIQEMNSIESFVRFEAYHNEYHIHQLLLDYLKTRKDEIPEDEKKGIWNKTAALCEANNQKIDAINYYKKAENYERLLIVCNTLPMMHSNRTAQMLLEILDKAPPEVYENCPLIYTHQVRIFMSLGMIEQAEKKIAEAISRLEAPPLSPLSHQILTMCYGNKGLTRLFAVTYTGDYDFVSDFERCVYHSRQSGGRVVPLPISVLNISSFICRVNKPEKGEMERYINMLETIVPLAAEALGGMEWGVDTLARAELAFFKGDLTEAEQFAQETIKRAREWDQYEVENRALFYLLRSNLARGTWEAIQSVCRHMVAQRDLVHYINRFTFHDILTASFYSRIGRMDKVPQWLKNDFEGSDFNSMNLGMEVLIKARCHMVERRYPSALATLSILENRNNPYDAGDFLFGMVSMKILDAVCRYRNHDKSGAFASLEQAYRLAAPNELDMPFIELGKDMRSLVEAVLKEGSNIPREWLEKIRLGASAYAKKLFTVAEQCRVKDEETVSRPLANDQVALSPREKEVLTALLQGMTRVEIAAQTSLSANTVKSITRSIYNKLGALNKADAVRIAAGMNLV